ncbi:hypothetical protein NI17_014215 [Thermobifida halotolerans]|uniref:Uncharacterized protein n=1 Tax=Thermobifida halotolerans TaxID=483545 RepID=A0AA97M6E7_9ACTN|nr:hypothetical protein NI17_014215 [Thermobifida halotolerans]
MVVCWLVGLVAWFVCNAAGTGVVVRAAPPEQLAAFEGVVLWYGSASLVCTLVAAASAALAHRAPRCDRVGRDAAAALGAPVASVAVNSVLVAAEPSPAWGVFLAPAALSLVGAVAGWLLVRALRSRPEERRGAAVPTSRRR